MFSSWRSCSQCRLFEFLLLINDSSIEFALVGVDFEFQVKGGLNIYNTEN